MTLNQESTPGVRAKILLVDDEPMVLNILRRILKVHDVTAVQRAEDAMKLITKGERFDLIFSDLIMPTMTGIDFYEWAQQFDPELPRRLVFLSGGAVTGKAQEFLRSVPNRCVEKPFDIYALRALVQELLSSPTSS